MQRARQTSESIELAALLALSGGLMDAYSFLGRGKVFANAQTGNMLLLGVNIADGDWHRAAHYALPVLAFAIGIALAHTVKHVSKGHHLHWRQTSLLIEATMLLLVSFMPQELDLLANSLTSLVCGMQVQAFRKLHGRGFATTMCIGNLRSGTHNLMDYVHDRKPEHLESALLYYGTILTFIIGAIIGSRLLSAFGLHAIVASSIPLAAAFCLMFWDREKHELEEERASEDTPAVR